MTQDPRSGQPESATTTRPEDTAAFASPDPAAAPPPGAAPQPGPSYGPPGTSPDYSAGDGYAAGAATLTLDAGQALGYGWRKFRDNSAPWLAVSAVGLGAWLLYMIAVRVIDNNSVFQVLLTIFAFATVLWLLQACMIRGALYELDGARPQFASFFRFVNPGRVVLAAILVFLAACVGSLLFVLPGIAVLYASIFVVQFAIDQHLDPIAAVVASGRLAFSSLQVALIAIAVAVMTALWPLLTLAGILVAGELGLVFALGLAITGPVSLIATTYAYRVLTGGPVAA